MSLQNLETQVLDDDVVERTQSACRQSRADLDEAIAPDLRVSEGLQRLLFAELLVLQTGLVGSNTLHHELLVVLREAFGSHGGVREEPKNETAPEDGERAIRDEDGLVASDDLVPNQREAICEQSAHNLLSSIHHVPVRNGLGLLLALVPGCESETAHSDWADNRVSMTYHMEDMTRNVG